jgi:hypothetical protein
MSVGKTRFFMEPSTRSTRKSYQVSRTPSHRATAVRALGIPRDGVGSSGQSESGSWRRSAARMHSKRSSWNCITRIWIRSRARLSARREKSSSGGGTAGEGRAVTRLCATGLGGAAVEASRSEIRRKSRIVQLPPRRNSRPGRGGARTGGKSTARDLKHSDPGRTAL